ncbi:MAG: redox-sensing transcriptional repressor Rex [Endomicrobia bacterium]|nr:redox-sensing transcriptional repressor Rex [Endomicrobiia bacterium]MCX7716745.1 redox-sensing transcriptional repressor Rex [Endomicrobiia bacterium]
MKKRKKKLSNRSITRLSLYYQFLLQPLQKKFILSKELADRLGVTSATVRKDLALFGQFGIPGKGYEIETLRSTLVEVLGLKRNWNVIVVGCGNLGSALMKYPGFARHNFNIIAGFDISPKIVGGKINNINVYHLNYLKNFVKKHKVDIAVITVPENFAQQTIEYVAKCGIKGILNFTPVMVTHIKPSVKILKIDLTVEFLRLACILSRIEQ